MTGQRMRGGNDELLYCSGPISGIDELARDAAFARSAKWAKEHAWRPVLPMDLPAFPHEGPCPRGRGGAPSQAAAYGAKVHNEACYLRNDYKALTQCSGILMAKGWRASWGCKHELMMAADIGLRIFFWSNNDVVVEVG